jgi:hypothetical protein
MKTTTERRKAGNAEERKLVEFFRTPEAGILASEGDADNISPAECAIRAMRRLIAQLGTLLTNGTGFVERDAYGVAAMEALDEVRRARGMFGPMASMHEGYAVILEELDEVKEIVWLKQKNRNLADARKEVLQVAAMCIAFAAELCTEERGRR